MRLRIRRRQFVLCAALLRFIDSWRLEVEYGCDILACGIVERNSLEWKNSKRITKLVRHLDFPDRQIDGAVRWGSLLPKLRFEFESEGLKLFLTLHGLVVKSTSPVTDNHYKNGYVKLYDDKNVVMTNVDNSNTTYINKHKNTKYNVRDMYE